MIDFAIPGVFSHFKLNVTLLGLMKDHPEYFQDNVEIAAVYGIFPFCIWDGGRTFNSYQQVSKEVIETATNKYYSLGARVRLILTNTQLKEEHYYDRFGNIMLNVCHKDTNQVVCSDDNFRNYIREHYPNYQFISSTTKCLNKTDFEAELNKEEYSEVCLDYNLNHNTKLLESLSDEQKNKCEFLINAICPPGCPSRKEHYKLNSLFYLGFGEHYRVPKCGIHGNTLAPDACNYCNNISPEDIYNVYAPMGFKHFKLEGRTLTDAEVANNYARYLVKPEYQLYVSQQLIDSCNIK